MDICVNKYNRRVLYILKYEWYIENILLLCTPGCKMIQQWYQIPIYLLNTVEMNYRSA